MMTDYSDGLQDRPTMDYTNGNGREPVEQLLVGWVDAPEDQHGKLKFYGIDITRASYDKSAGRLFPCLFTEAQADELTAAALEKNDLPFSFEAWPSVGGLKVLEARHKNLPVPAIDDEEWNQPATLAAMALAVAGSWVQSSWLRRGVSKVQ